MTVQRITPVLSKKGLVFLAVISLLVALFAVSRPVQAACASFPQDKGTVTVSGSAPTSATYYIWSRNRTATSSNNGYYLQIDGSTSNCFTVGDATLPANTWTWVNYQNGNTSSRMSVSLSAGNHSFKLYGVDSSVMVDRILLTASQSCTPIGDGSNCTDDGVTPPVVVGTPGGNGTVTPNGTTGTIQVGTTSPGAKNIVKIDGKEVASGEGQQTIDTSTLSDGYHNITITTIGPDGEVSTQVRSIYIDNNKNLWQIGYTWIYEKTGQDKMLTNVIAYGVTVLLLAAVGVGAYLFWVKRLWERIPLINRVHIPFLRVPAVVRETSAKITKKLLFWQKSAAVSEAVTGAVVVGGEQAGETPSIRVNIFHHMYSLKPIPVVVIMLFALIGSALALSSFAATNGFIVEPDNGTLTTGATKGTGNGSSNNGYIQFGTGSCPAGQTGTPPNCTTPPPATCPVGQTGTPPNCTIPPPVSGTEPTRANTGPRYSMTNMSADQFLDSGVCNRQRITEHVTIDGNHQGEHFVINDCEFAGGFGVYTHGGGVVAPLNQMASIEANYTDFGGGGISLVNPLSTFKMTHSWNDGGQWAVMDQACDTGLHVNGTNYDIQDSIFERALNGDPSEHLEGLHTCGYVDNQKFTNTKFLVSGSGISPVTGTINFHGKNSIFEHCYFVFNVSAPYNITFNAYIDGPNNRVQNSYFSTLGGEVYPNSPQMATYSGNKNYDTGQNINLP